MKSIKHVCALLCGGCPCAIAIAWSGNPPDMTFIFYEVLTFSTYPLVTTRDPKEAITAGQIYMGILVGTSVILLLPAILWVWTTTGTLDFTKGGILKGVIDPVCALLRLYLHVGSAKLH